MAFRSFLHGARRGGRTLTPLREPDFESGASTNSAIRAYSSVYLLPMGFMTRVRKLLSFLCQTLLAK